MAKPYLMHKMIPPGYTTEQGYKDIKCVGGKFYLIWWTLANGVGGGDYSCTVYTYDITNETWEEITTCGEDCEFVDNRIKTPYLIDGHYQTEWIDMK
ncbi:MAG: hypothetical protein NC131_15340 [Roseburia sp.]|nr:hypothetical protein [Roseburia sp.]